MLFYYPDVSCITRQNELSAILRFGAEELFKEDKTDEETKRNLESLDIDEILERAEKVETKGGEGEEGNELLSAFKACDVTQVMMLSRNYSVFTFIIRPILRRLQTFPVAKMMQHSGVG
jgi:chromodomain-helicase-DNA-binding protein 1